MNRGCEPVPMEPSVGSLTYAQTPSAPEMQWLLRFVAVYIACHFMSETGFRLVGDYRAIRWNTALPWMFSSTCLIYLGLTAGVFCLQRRALVGLAIALAVLPIIWGAYLRLTGNIYMSYHFLYILPVAVIESLLVTGLYVRAERRCVLLPPRPAVYVWLRGGDLCWCLRLAGLYLLLPTLTYGFTRLLSAMLEPRTYTFLEENQFSFVWVACCLCAIPCLLRWPRVSCVLATLLLVATMLFLIPVARSRMELGVFTACSLLSRSAIAPATTMAFVIVLSYRASRARSDDGNGPS